MIIGRPALSGLARSGLLLVGGLGVFERFTDRARRVLVLAQEEARLLNHSFIGTEHILLGLIHEGEGVAAQALEQLDISLEAVREKVEQTIGPSGSAPTGSPPLTPRAKKALELSLREALALGHKYVSTEHILLGLVREGEGVAAQVLVSMGVDLARVRQEVLRLLSGHVPDEAFRPLPEPEPPNFDRLPSGTRETFERRLDRLPIGRIHSKIAAQAIMRNESRALHQYERQHGLPWEDFVSLGTWHMRATHDRISARRPDLMLPRRPSGSYVTMRRLNKFQGFLVRWRLWNVLNGTGTWIHNRAVNATATALRLGGQR